MTHGMYSNVLTDEELEMYESIPIGNLDQELKVARIRLMRGLKAKQLIDADPNNPNNTAGFEVSEIRQKQQGGNGGANASNEVIRRRPDVDGAIDRCLARIGNLERIRAELLQNTDLSSPDEFAQQIRSAMDAMNSLTVANNGDDTDG